MEKIRYAKKKKNGNRAKCYQKTDGTADGQMDGRIYGWTTDRPNGRADGQGQLQNQIKIKISCLENKPISKAYQKEARLSELEERCY